MPPSTSRATGAPSARSRRREGADLRLHDQGLIIRAKTSPEAAAELVQAARPFLLSRIGRVRGLPPSVDRDDLLQEAAIGLLRAVRYYDPSRGTLFTTLAAICVDQAVGSCVEEAWSFGMRPRNRDDAPKVVVVDPDFLMPPEEDDDLEEES